MGDTEYICNTLRATRTQAQIEAERKRSEHRRKQAQAIERNRRIRQASTHCDKHEREINRGNMTSQFDRDLFMQECRKLQWLAQYKCRRCLDSGIIYHRNGMEEPCDYCDAFSKKLERRAQLPGQAAATLPELN